MRVDLRSDTVTIPTREMLEAMMQAPVGDDVFGDDPSVNALESKASAMFSKEAALFCPSGTMTNQIAIRLHTVPGSEVICHKDAHIYKYEGGGIALNSLSSVALVDGNRGRLSALDVQERINKDDIHVPPTKMVAIEDSMNRGGGAIYDFMEIKKIKDLCTQHRLALHLDGARVFNALIENGMDYKVYANPFDTISICLSKGLGSPVGSLLLGSKEQMQRARRFRKVMGGGMRQAGYLAAAGIYALDHHIVRLKEDHRRARDIESMLKKLSYVHSILPVQTNIVLFELDKTISVDSFLSSLREKNIYAIAFGPHSVRMITHLGINDAMLEILDEALRSFSSRNFSTTLYSALL